MRQFLVGYTSAKFILLTLLLYLLADVETGTGYREVECELTTNVSLLRRSNRGDDGSFIFGGEFRLDGQKRMRPSIPRTDDLTSPEEQSSNTETWRECRAESKADVLVGGTSG
jgi:hypothetical protein